MKTTSFFSCPLYSEKRGLLNRLHVSKYNNWFNLDVQDKIKKCIWLKRKNTLSIIKYLNKIHNKRKTFLIEINYLVFLVFTEYYTVCSMIIYIYHIFYL